MSNQSSQIDARGDSSQNVSDSTSPSEIRKQSIQRCIQSLCHACNCRDVNCHRPSCIKMKRVVQHAKSCKKKGIQVHDSAGCPTLCPICKQLIALCCYHAKHCDEANCSVPYCANIKRKVKHQQLQQRLYQAQIVERRIASMASLMSQPQNCQSSSSNNSPSTPFNPQHNQSNMETAAFETPHSSHEEVDHSVDLEVLDELFGELELDQ